MKRLIPDSECIQSKCALTTVGCWGQCEMRRSPSMFGLPTPGACIVSVASPVQGAASSASGAKYEFGKCVWCGASSNTRDRSCSAPDGDGHLFERAAQGASGAKGAADPSALLTEDHRERIIGAVLGAFPSTVTSAPTARRMMAQLVWNTEQACIAALAERAQADANDKCLAASYRDLYEKAKDAANMWRNRALKAERAQAAQPSGAAISLLRRLVSALDGKRAAGMAGEPGFEFNDQLWALLEPARVLIATPAPEQEAAQVGRAALTTFIDKFCLGKPELVACAESAFYWFNKCLSAPVAQEAEQPQGDVMRPFGAPAGQHEAGAAAACEVCGSASAKPGAIPLCDPCRAEFKAWQKARATATNTNQPEGEKGGAA